MQSSSTARSTTTATCAPSLPPTAGNSPPIPIPKFCSWATWPGARPCSTDCAACSPSPFGTARPASSSARATSSASSPSTTPSARGTSSSRRKSRASWSIPPTSARSTRTPWPHISASSSRPCPKPSSRASSSCCRAIACACMPTAPSASAAIGAPPTLSTAIAAKPTLSMQSTRPCARACATTTWPTWRWGRFCRAASTRATWRPAWRRRIPQSTPSAWAFRSTRATATR